MRTSQRVIDRTRATRGTLSIAARKHGVSLSAMKSRLLAFITLIIASFLTLFLPAQDTDKEVDDAIQEATESAKKIGVKMPDMKKQIEEANKEEAKEKAALQKQLEAPGPVTLPDWTPKVPQFKPAGRVFKEDCRRRGRYNPNRDFTAHTRRTGR